MSTPTPAGDGPTTESEFNQHLGSLLASAYRNGIDVEGGWEYRHSGSDLPDWGVEIYVVESKP